MPIKTFQFMESLTASDMNRYFMQQLFVMKQMDESVTNSNVLQDDNELFVDVLANTDYWVTCMFRYEGAANPDGDFRMGWSAPSGTTFDWVSDGFGSNASSSIEVISRSAQTLVSSPAPGTVGLGTDLFANAKGVLCVGANAGTFRFRWAQLNPTTTVSTRLKARSMMVLRRLTT